MPLENKLDKTLKNTNSTGVGFYYLQALSFTACAGPDLNSGMWWGLAARGRGWRWGDVDGCYLQVTKLTVCERVENFCPMERFPWGLKARCSSAGHPDAEGALPGEYLVLWSHLIRGSNTSHRWQCLHKLPGQPRCSVSIPAPRSWDWGGPVLVWPPRISLAARSSETPALNGWIRSKLKTHPYPRCNL